MEITGYNRDFQVGLLTQLVADPDLYKDTASYLKTGDFDLPVCRVIYEALRNCYKLCDGARPPLDLLQLQVVRLVENADGKAETVITPEENEGLANIMRTIWYTAARPADPIHTTYFKKELGAYLRHVRMAQIIDSYGPQIAMGYGADQVIQHALAINKEVATNNDLVLENMNESSPEETVTRHISTGLRQLNDCLAGGLGVGQLGMVTGCPGVGKTNTMINFMSGAVLTGVRSLYITLELAADRIKQRYYTIVGGIDARYIKVPRKYWPASIQKRYEYIMNPEYKYFGYSTIVDGSRRKLTIADIDRTVGEWQEVTAKKIQRGQPECFAVYVDWLDLLSQAGLSNLRKESRDDVALTRINEEFSMLSRKYGVAFWTATQGTQQADEAEKMRMSHTAGAYHKNDAIDVGLGLALVKDYNAVEPGDRVAVVPQETFDSAINTDGTVNIERIGKPCSRKMMLSLTKNRDNQLAYIDVYQGSTLQYFNHQQEHRELLDRNEACDLIGDYAKAHAYAKDTIGKQLFI